MGAPAECPPRHCQHPAEGPAWAGAPRSPIFTLRTGPPVSPPQCGSLAGCHPHTVGLWLGAGCSVPHRELPDLIQAGLGMLAADTWQCPARVSAPDPISPSTLCFYTAFQADSFVSKVFLQFFGYCFILLHLVDGVMEFLLIIMSLGHSADFGCPITHPVICIPVTSCCFQGHFAEGGPGRLTLTQYWCTD